MAKYGHLVKYGSLLYKTVVHFNKYNDDYRFVSTIQCFETPHCQNFVQLPQWPENVIPGIYVFFILLLIETQPCIYLTRSLSKHTWPWYCIDNSTTKVNFISGGLAGLPTVVYWTTKNQGKRKKSSRRNRKGGRKEKVYRLWNSRLQIMTNQTSDDVTDYLDGHKQYVTNMHASRQWSPNVTYHVDIYIRNMSQALFV